MQKGMQMSYLGPAVFFAGAILFLISSLVTSDQKTFDAYSGSDLPWNCSNNCGSSFGTALGRDAKSVTGYSNCNDKCVSELDNFISIQGAGKQYTGMQWQCVEYARRWLISVKGFTFQSVDMAYEIWTSVNTLETIKDNKPVSFAGYLNGQTSFPPSVGCLLIYSNQLCATGSICETVYT